MNKGDIVLIPFPFTDLSGNKLRPAVVLYSNELDVTVSFITSNLRLKNEYDLEIKKSKYNFLKVDSVLKTSKIATLNKDLVVGMLGVLNAHEISQMNEKLKELLKLK
ncbi:MAG: type II toxin-antitoxin system PemK/MazF family toxin [Weeksellaceae bacterium]|nr:type II toxin-antitoxin system PemK/MazF family toxin [Bacteroidota bacterium]MCG2781184.1 type II toxin-antitoxin system PemK/MazF family toxin [Weeksellaceae bacterium]